MSEGISGHKPVEPETKSPQKRAKYVVIQAGGVRQTSDPRLASSAAVVHRFFITNRQQLTNEQVRLFAHAAVPITSRLFHWLHAIFSILRYGQSGEAMMKEVRQGAMNRLRTDQDIVGGLKREFMWGIKGLAKIAALPREAEQRDALLEAHRDRMTMVLENLQEHHLDTPTDRRVKEELLRDNKPLLDNMRELLSLDFLTFDSLKELTTKRVHTAIKNTLSKELPKMAAGLIATIVMSSPSFQTLDELKMHVKKSYRERAQLRAGQDKSVLEYEITYPFSKVWRARDGSIVIDLIPTKIWNKCDSEIDALFENQQAMPVLEKLLHMP